MAAQAPNELQPGEHVAWNYGAGQARGQVVEKLTEDKKLGARVFKATPDDPKYLVKSDASGKEAIKKPETLHKVDGDAKDSSNEHPPKGSSKGTKSKKSGKDAQKEEIGAKEKRDGLMKRSTEEEQKEVEEEEMGQKVQKTGKGSARRIAEEKGGGNRTTDELDEEFDSGIEEDDDEEEDDAGEEDEYKPREDELKAVEEEEMMAERADMEVKEAKDELADAVDGESGKNASGEMGKSGVEDFIVEDGAEDEDPDKPYEPSEEEVKTAETPARAEQEGKKARQEV